MLEITGSLHHTSQRTPAVTLRKLWLWPNLLSLDAVLIAVLWQELFARAFRAELFPASRVALACTVWLIYLADRLLDVLREPVPLTARHRFHHAHRPAALILIAVASGIALRACCLLQPRILQAGELCAIFALAYLCTVHLAPRFTSFRLPKEPAVALIFAAGTALAPAESRSAMPSLIPIALFACLCFLNCACIEHLESCLYSSPADWLSWTSRRLPLLAVWVALCALAAALLASQASRELYTALALSAFSIAWFMRHCARFSPDLARVLAEVPLLAPALFLAFR